MEVIQVAQKADSRLGLAAFVENIDITSKTGLPDMFKRFFIKNADFTTTILIGIIILQIVMPGELRVT